MRPELPAPVEPPDDVPYQGLMRRSPLDPTRPLVVLMLALLGYVLAAVLAQALLLALQPVAAPDVAPREWLRAGLALENPTGMLATNLALAALVPFALVAMRLGAGLEPRWVHSVQPGFRWRYAALVAVPALLVLGTVVALSGRFDLLHPKPEAQWVWFVVVILLTSPLQAAGEEYLFRGLLMPALGAWARSPWAGVAGSALLFALVHGAQSPALFCDRLAFGLLAGVLVWRTGGLEAGVAIHAVNNVLAFGLATLYGSVAGTRATQTLGWAEAAVDVLTFALAAGAALWLAGRLNLATTTPGVVDLHQRADVV